MANFTGETSRDCTFGVRIESRLLLGTVQRLLETGANDVLVVTPSDDSIDDRERLIPWLPDEVIKQVDLQEKTIAVSWFIDA